MAVVILLVYEERSGFYSGNFMFGDANGKDL